MDSAPSGPNSPSPTASTATAAAGVAFLLLVVLAGWPDGPITPQTTRFVTTASHDGASTIGGQPNAVSIHGLANDLVFDPPGRFSEFEDGSASLVGVARRASDPSVAFAVDVRFSGRVLPTEPTHPPAGSPKLELVPATYADQSGPVDPTSWAYYPKFAGTLIGQDAMEGAVIDVTRRGPALQVGVGASGKNARLGASAWIDLRVISPPDEGDLPLTMIGDFNFDLTDERQLCATDAVPGELSQLLSEHAITLPGIVKSLTFVSPGRLVERADGTVSLTGVVAKRTNPNKGFFVDIELSGRVDPGHDQHVPPGGPTIELVPETYAENGGPIDPATWSYFAVVSGTLTGYGTWKGAKLRLTRFGPAAQLGYGANGKNLGYGIGTWLTAKVEKAPPGVDWPKKVNGDLDADLDEECPTCSADPSPTALAKDPMHVSMVLPGYAEDLVQVTPGRFVERTDGTARLDALLARASDPSRVLHLELDLAGRLVRGDEDHPPGGSPWMGLKKKAHRKKSGPAHPGFWTYFDTFEGRLTGLGAWAGLKIELVRHEVAPQLGFGASGESQGFGGAVPFVWAPSPPTSEPGADIAAFGELRFRLGADCVDGGGLLPVSFGPACAPPAAVAPELVLLGVPGLGPVRLEIRNGPPDGTAFLFLGTGRGAAESPTGCLLAVESVLAILGPFPLDDDGELAIDAPLAGYMVPTTLTMQAFVRTATTVSATQGVEVTIP